MSKLYRNQSVMRAVFAAGAWTVAACASMSSGVTERDFARAGADDVPLRSLELVVVVAGPPRVAEDTFAVRGFAPPVDGTPLIEGAEHASTRDALAGELARQLRAAGFDVRVRTAAAPVVVPAPVAVRTASTASVATASAAPMVTTLPASAAVTLTAALSAADDLSAVRNTSDADAVLVVRAVPVDAFTVDVGVGTRWIDTPLGREQVRDFRPVRTEGRLMVGQAFLFERTSGVRLWSRQAPDYPSDGRLIRSHPFLASGYVQGEGEPAAPEIVRATAASRAFARTILSGLPRARVGRVEARVALTSLDAERIAARDAFFDEGHLLVDVSAGWGGESSDVDVTLGETLLEPLGAGAVTPLGMPRVAPRVSWLAPGGALYAATLTLGVAPSSFGRTYWQDNPLLTTVDTHRAIRLSVGGVTSVGGQLDYGRVFAVGAQVFIVPTLGAYFDVWTLDAAPDPFVDSGVRLRVGAALGGEAWLRLSEQWYLRGGASGRVGGDLSGGLTVGGALSLGVGLML